MSKKILFIILIIIILTGCGNKENKIEFINSQRYGEKAIIETLSKNDDKLYDDKIGFINEPEYAVAVFDNDEKFVDISTNPLFYPKDLINDDYTYIKYFLRPFDFSIKGIYKKKKIKHIFLAQFTVKITNPKNFTKNIKTKDLKIEDLYNLYFKEIITKNLNEIIDKAIISEQNFAVDYNILTVEFNNLFSEDMEKKGYNIKLEQINKIDEEHN